MKGKILYLVILSGLTSLSVAAQGPASRSCNTVDPPVSHWSADFKLGPGYSSTHDIDFNVGGAAEYSVNPFFGFGFEGLYAIRQDALDVLGYGSLNLSNLTAPFRTGYWKRTNIFAEAGGGLRWAGSGSMLILAGLSSEYNLNDALALEMGGDLLYGLDKGINLTVGLRYKFGVSWTKHARNISMNEYRPQPSPIIIHQTVWVDASNASLKRLEKLEKSNTDLLLSLQATEESLKNYRELFASQDSSKAATKAVDKPSTKPGIVIFPPVTLAPTPITAASVGMVSSDSLQITSKSGNGEKLPANAGSSRVNAAHQPPQLKVANVVTGTMNPVEFLSASSQMTPDSKLILDEMASTLLSKEWKNMTIVGNTDNQGNPQNNKILSLKRAVIVKNYLISKGLPSKKLKVRGDGGTHPINTNKTPLGRRLNRRVDFILEN